MSFFSSTTAKILYAIALGAVIYFAAVQKMSRSGVSSSAPPSGASGLAPAR
jgi:hypothetical protein